MHAGERTENGREALWNTFMLETIVLFASLREACKFDIVL